MPQTRKDTAYWMLGEPESLRFWTGDAETDGEGNPIPASPDVTGKTMKKSDLVKRIDENQNVVDGGNASEDDPEPLDNFEEWSDDDEIDLYGWY